MRAVAKPTSRELRRLVPGRMVQVAGSAHHVVVDEGPDDAPPVVFTSGLGGAWYDWDAVVPLLAGRATLVRFDRPGLGWSQPVAVPPTLAAEAGRIRELLRVLELERPAVLVGHSLAGFHVEAFARMFPELTAGVVLVDGSTEPEAAPQPAYSQRVRRWRLIGGVGRASGIGGLIGPAAWRLIIAGTTLGGPGVADPSQVRATFAAGRPGVTAMVENTLYYDVAAELLELRCERDFPPVPLQVLAAFGRSRIERAIMPRGLAAQFADRWRRRQRDLAELSPRGELVELKDSGHYIPFDRPDAVADAVLNVIEAMDIEHGDGSRARR
ncbi:MAG TPA: alpha/beta hydrolase [Actinocrinis sp.]|uniref:alpha/beta fold hydrolase n=1 Tax=Actinocrinis sp. TaxID=1920516 RepID=UPI002D72FDCD|nr:alpha/beta hydrolase [Actinocrinis sp.]HZU58105.1 alpha/beta hydrolase [Actinocrinis sp.]